MLHQHSISDIIANFLSLFESKPHLLYFANLAKLENCNYIPNYPLNFYSFDGQDTRVFYVLINNKLNDGRRPILVAGSENQKSSNDVKDGLSEILKINQNLRNIYLVISHQKITESISEFLQQNCGLKFVEHFPCNNFYIPTANFDAILDSKNEIKLEQGFELTSTNLKDAETVNSTWIHSKPASIHHIKELLKHLPTSCIYQNNQPISYEMIGILGTLSHHYTIPEHRGKGLGTIIENDLIAKVIRIGLTPSKSVELHNSSVLRRSFSDPRWNAVHLGNEPEIVNYSVFS